MRRVCDFCGIECRPQGCATGYAIRSDGRTLCYPCAADHEAREIRSADVGEPLFAYFDVTPDRTSGHGRLTTWTGALLGYVRWHQTRSGFGGCRYYFRGCVQGRWVSGNSPGPGMFARFRSTKRVGW